MQADARTIHALGGFACMAITALTAQNTRGVKAWEPVKPAMIRRQIEAVMSDPGALPIRALKTGLLPGAAAVRAIASTLRESRVPLVVDPVIGSTTGTLFLDAAGLRALRRELLPLATLVTPNWPEAEQLSGAKIGTIADAERVATSLARDFNTAVLLKGGHAPGNRCRDILAEPNGAVHVFESRRAKTSNTHGTGCVLSAAIATELAQGRSLQRAVANARTFLGDSLHAHRSVAWGGAGPAFPGR